MADLEQLLRESLRDIAAGVPVSENSSPRAPAGHRGRWVGWLAVAGTAVVTTAVILAVVFIGGRQGTSGDRPAGPAPSGGLVKLTLVPHASLTEGQLRAAESTIVSRLKAQGQSEVAADVGDNSVEVALPPSGVAVLKRIIATPGVLQLRQVLEVGALHQAVSLAHPVTIAPTLSQQLTSTFAMIDCGDAPPLAGRPSESGDYVIACSAGSRGGPAYVLGPAQLTSLDIQSASASLPATGGLNWLVNLTFTPRGGQRWFDLTKRAYEAGPANKPSGTCHPPTGCNGIAFVLDGVVVSAPSSEVPGIPGGSAQITGNYTQQQASQLAVELSTKPLPTPFTIRASQGGQPVIPAGDGVVTGRLLAVGGPAIRVGGPPVHEGMPGGISIRRNGHPVAETIAGTDGRFSVALRPGIYQLQGAHGLQCYARRPVTVTRGQMSVANVYCEVR